MNGIEWAREQLDYLEYDNPEAVSGLRDAVLTVASIAFHAGEESVGVDWRDRYDRMARERNTLRAERSTALAERDALQGNLIDVQAQCVEKVDAVLADLARTNSYLAAAQQLVADQRQLLNARDTDLAVRLDSARAAARSAQRRARSARDRLTYQVEKVAGDRLRDLRASYVERLRRATEETEAARWSAQRWERQAVAAGRELATLKQTGVPAPEGVPDPDQYVSTTTQEETLALHLFNADTPDHQRRDVWAEVIAARPTSSELYLSIARHLRAAGYRKVVQP